MESHTPHTLDAREALREVAAQRRLAGDRLVTPRWYYPVLAVLAGGALASVSSHSVPVVIVAAVVYFAGITALVIAYRRINGVWVSGLRRGPAGWVGVRLVVLVEAVTLAGLALEFGAHLRGACVAAGVVAAVLIIRLGRRFDETLRAELQDEL